MLRLKCSLQFSFLSNGVLLADSPIKFPALFISATSLARPSISLSFLLSLSHTHIPFKCKQTLFRAHSQSVHLTSSNTSYYETGFDWVEVSSSKNLLFSKWNFLQQSKMTIIIIFSKMLSLISDIIERSKTYNFAHKFTES